MYRGIFSLTVNGANGDLEARVTCDFGYDFTCDVLTLEQDLAGLRQFFALKPEVALETTLTLVHWCIETGGFTPERVYNPCEGGLFSLGFIDGVPADRVILQSFKRYQGRELSPEEREALSNLFYPSWYGINWLHERQQATEWVALIEALDREHALFDPDQLEIVRRTLLSRPTHEDRHEYSYPPFSIHRRLRALVQ
jgi:hypothetical protein